jgi:hypothetical protein
VSETISAALYLVSRNMKVDEVLVKLTPGEVDLVLDIVQRWPDHFPLRAVAALKNGRPTSSPEPSAPSAACGSPDAALTRGNVGPTRAYRPAAPQPTTEAEHATHRPAAPQPTTEAEHATPTNAEKPGTLSETTRRRMVVDDLMGSGLSVRTISAGTGIPRSSVHRATRAIARAEAKKVVVIAEIAKALLGKKTAQQGQRVMTGAATRVI